MDETAERGGTLFSVNGNKKKSLAPARVRTYINHVSPIKRSHKIC